MCDQLEDMPPSVKLVYKVLEYEGECTLPDVREETLLPQRTARYALERLEAEELVDKRPNPSDARQSLYTIRS